MKRKTKKILLITGLILIILIITISLTFVFGLQKVSKDSEEVIFEVKKNEGRKEIINNLDAAGLIKNKYITLVYVYLSGSKIQAGTYKINRNDSTIEIINTFAKGDVYDARKVIKVTFIEGERITDYAKVIANNFNYSYDEIISLLKDTEYAKSLISKYDILTDDILNKDIMYPLEGYLFADTYEFYEDVSLETIIEKMLTQTSNKIIKIKDNLNDSNLSIHELLTISAIVEKEALNSTDRSKVAQVIFSRLDKKMNLGMDVTTYYAVSKSLKEGLTKKDLASENKYNTRNSNNIGLPPGPICSPSFESITATLNPSTTTYLYFYANLETGKVTFFESYDDFVVFKNNN